VRDPAVTISPFEREDAATLAAWLSDPHMLCMTAPDWPHPITAQEIERAYFGPDAADGLFKALAHGGDMVGHAGLRAIQSNGLLFHVIVDPARQRRGYGLAMMREVLAAAFTEHSLHRVVLHVFDENVGAIAFYLSCGFAIEGHHREAYRCGARWLDTYSMGMLYRDWERRTGGRA
jgi:RimJ/RimL family protein N-acetyltransferase